MSRFIAKRFASLEAYTPGEQPQDMEYIKLNTNELPYPPSPLVIKSITESDIADLRLYSDPCATALKTRLAEFYGVKKENVFTSNGSDEALDFAFSAFGDSGVVFPDITYGFYRVFAEKYNIPYVEIPLDENFGIDIGEYKNAGKLIAIANPNAPTGLSLSLSQIEEIVISNKENVVIIDEAYIDFGGESVVPLIKKYDNLLVVQTYSKSRAMAGTRLGYAIGNAELIKDLEKLKYSTNPYNLDRLTQKAGVAALDDALYYVLCCNEIKKTRTFITDELRSMGFTVINSDANFIFARAKNISGEKIYLELKKRGILVRHFTKARIENYNRITIGTRMQMETLAKAMREIIEQEMI